MEVANSGDGTQEEQDQIPVGNNELPPTTVASPDDGEPQSTAQSSVERAKLVLGITDLPEESSVGQPEHITVQDARKILSSIRSEFVTKHVMTPATVFSSESPVDIDPSSKQLDSDKEDVLTPSLSLSLEPESHVETQKTSESDLENKQVFKEESDSTVTKESSVDDEQDSERGERLTDATDRTIPQQTDVVLEKPVVQESDLQDEEVSRLSLRYCFELLFFQEQYTTGVYSTNDYGINLK